MRARRIASWALAASIAAYLLLIAGRPLGLIDGETSFYIGSLAAVAIGLSAIAWIAIHIVVHSRERERG